MVGVVKFIFALYIQEYVRHAVPIASCYCAFADLVP